MTFGLDLAQDLFGAAHNAFGQAGQTGDLDAVALLNAAGNDFFDKNDLFLYATLYLLFPDAYEYVYKS